jgi:hypothetical protein
MKCPLLGIALFALTSFLARGPAQESEQPDPPKSQPSRKAKAKYEDEMEKLEQEFAKRHADLLKQYVKDLDDARKEALGKEQLDEAQQILALKKSLQEENETVKPGMKSPPAKRGLVIEKALFGTEGSWADITTQVRRLVRGSTLRIGDLNINNNREGTGIIDPAPNRFKELVIIYTSSGKVNFVIAKQGQDVEISAARKR